jgi:hypothetical protein
MAGEERLLTASQPRVIRFRARHSKGGKGSNRKSRDSRMTSAEGFDLAFDSFGKMDQPEMAEGFKI